MMSIYDEKTELMQQTQKDLNRELIGAIGLNFCVWCLVGVLAYMLAG